MPLNNCAGFIDGSNQYCDRPGKYQRILYNGHKHAHLVKWQGIMLPNGIMPMPFGLTNDRHHDAFMLDTVKKSPPTFVQAGPMDPWALMQKALLDALVL